MRPDTPMHAIRLKCIECSCGQLSEVRLCHIKDCALWAYRFGHRPQKSAPARALETEQAAGDQGINNAQNEAESSRTTAFNDNEVHS